MPSPAVGARRILSVMDLHQRRSLRPEERQDGLCNSPELAPEGRDAACGVSADSAEADHEISASARLTLCVICRVRLRLVRETSSADVRRRKRGPDTW